MLRCSTYRVGILCNYLLKLSTIVECVFILNMGICILEFCKFLKYFFFFLRSWYGFDCFVSSGTYWSSRTDQKKSIWRVYKGPNALWFTNAFPELKMIQKVKQSCNALWVSIKNRYSLYNPCSTGGPKRVIDVAKSDRS